MTPIATNHEHAVTVKREPLIVEVPTVLTRIEAQLKAHQYSRVRRRHRQKGTARRDK